MYIEADKFVSQFPFYCYCKRIRFAQVRLIQIFKQWNGFSKHVVPAKVTPMKWCTFTNLCSEKVAPQKTFDSLCIRHWPTVLKGYKISSHLHFAPFKISRTFRLKSFLLPKMNFFLWGGDRKILPLYFFLITILKRI